MRDPSVSAGYAQGLVALAVARGADVGALLHAAQIAPAALADLDGRIPLPRYVALMRAAKAMTREPALALHYGEVSLGDVSIVGLIGQASETVADAFAQLNRYVRLVVDVDVGTTERFRLRPGADGLWLIDTRTDADAFPELTESAFAQLICAPRRAGVERIALAAQVTHAEPPYAAEYARIFRAPVAFASDRNAIRLDPASLSQRIALLPRYVFGVLIDRADALMAELDSARTTRGRVEAALTPALHKGPVSMSVVAGQLGLSERTLSRKLKAEGATYERVLDDLRRTMALRYLDGGKVSVCQTAYLVGFSDAAAFSRAFKRWTGASPRARRVRGNT